MLNFCFTAGEGKQIVSKMYRYTVASPTWIKSLAQIKWCELSVCDLKGMEEGLMRMYSVSHCCPAATESLCTRADLQFTGGRVLQCVCVCVSKCSMVI